MRRLSVLWILPPIAAGVAAAIWFVTNAPAPARSQTPAPGLAVHVETVAARKLRPVARGWGNIRASETWTAIAEVRGQIVWRHADLESGAMIAAGTEVIRIDPGDYDLAISQAEADLASLAAESRQIAAEAENTARVREIEQARLVISESDLIRVRDLVAQGAAAQTRADETERALLQVRRAVAELQNSLALIPARQARIEAQTARTQAALDRARRDLAHTSVTTPIDIRIADVPVERFQVVAVGQPLLSGNGITAAEVVVQVPIEGFRRLIAPGQGIDNALAALAEGPFAAIGVELRLVADPAQVWQGAVTRIEGALDPRARTVPVVVEIADPYLGALPPLRLPLVPNMRVTVSLRGPEMAQAIAIPQAALHGDLVYLAGDDDRLELRPVTVAFRQDGIAVISDGLAIGDRIVTDDIAPAIPGMALTPVEAPE